jgi:Domain of unknown function (DUF4365)
LDTIRRGAAGRDLVAFQVRSQLNSDWQNVDAENDDSVDGAVFLRHGGKFLGRVISVQVKSGPSFMVDYKQKRFAGLMGVHIGEEYIRAHRPRWDALPGPVILAYVADPERRDSAIYWQDLKNEDSYSSTNKSVVLVPRMQTLGSEAKGALRRLAGSVPDNAPLNQVDVRKAQSLLPYPIFDRSSAREFYTLWSRSTDRNHPELGEIEVTNAGWRHMTRRSRGLENVHNSFTLLETARQMVIQGAGWRQLGSAKTRERSKAIDIVDAISLRANIVFRYRAAGTVQVILRRTRVICKSTGHVRSRIYFYSVHELRRGNSIHYGPY